jgi:hypothetical protein
MSISNGTPETNVSNNTVETTASSPSPPTTVEGEWINIIPVNPAELPAYAFRYSAEYHGIMLSIFHDNPEITAKQESTAGYCSPGRVKCTATGLIRGTQRKPSMAWMAYQILTLIPGGHATIGAILDIATEVYPQVKIERQSNRAALTRSDCFINLKAHKLWRIRCIGEDRPPKNKGGAKARVKCDDGDDRDDEKSAGKGTGRKRNAPAVEDGEDENHKTTAVEVPARKKERKARQSDSKNNNTTKTGEQVSVKQVSAASESFMEVVPQEVGPFAIERQNNIAENDNINTRVDDNDGKDGSPTPHITFTIPESNSLTPRRTTRPSRKVKELKEAEQIQNEDNHIRKEPKKISRASKAKKKPEYLQVTSESEDETKQDTTTFNNKTGLSSKINSTTTFYYENPNLTTS